ncbi:hypothetical protein Aglo01_66660 [Actinokineospora globicatena]|nr:hypothetical protein Aglo01_66660 [Actinokineospora globicatena]
MIARSRATHDTARTTRRGLLPASRAGGQAACPRPFPPGEPARVRPQWTAAQQAAVRLGGQTASGVGHVVERDSRGRRGHYLEVHSACQTTQPYRDDLDTRDGLNQDIEAAT